MADRLQQILDSSKAPNIVKADAWDAFHSAKSPEEFKATFDRLPLLPKVKADLFDLKFNSAQPQAQPSQARQLTGFERMTQEEPIASGFAKGFGQTVNSVSKLINRIPFVGETLAPSVGIKVMDQLTRPQNTREMIGAGLEQAAELMVPGGAINRGVKTASTFGKLARFGTRVGLESLNAGTSAALHGQDPVMGAATGAVGGVIGEGLEAVAPKIAESALGVRIKDRFHGKTPGRAILQDTKGMTPAVVEQSASDQTAKLTTQLETAARRSAPRASIRDAIGAIDEEIQKATQENSADTVKKLMKIKQQLTVDITTGQPFSKFISPLKLLQLKRGIGKLVKTWNPEEATSVQSAVQRIYGALDGELERTVPIASEINQRISSLIPVAKRAETAANSAGVVGDLVERFRRPTGALAASAIGAGVGYQQGGTDGAIKGAVIGMAPSLAINPNTMLTAARLFNSPLKNRAIQIGQGIFLQAVGYDDNGNLLMRPVAPNPEE